jgi:hypothetical protein
MVAAAIALQRLRQQRLSQHPLATPGEIVAWMGAVQSQDYPGAKWSLGMRMQQATEAMIDHAFNDGAILRTHIMRPTWHFVTPTDIRWLLALTSPRVHATNGYMYRQCELDDALFPRSNAIIAAALQGGHYLTRAELRAALAQSGIVASGVRLGCIIMRAELDAVVCSGPRRGKQFTYALLDERAPQARVLPRDEALAELTLRYFTGHGPATIRDFAWWSGLTMADAKAGLAMVASRLTHEVIDSQPYWFAASLPATEPSWTTFLLPTYDEFLVGFAAFGESLRGGQDADANAVFTATMVIGGQVVGHWRRTFKKNGVVIELAPFAPLTAVESEAISVAAQRYGEFVGMPVLAQ